jgi:hypothetical protein
MARSQGRQDTAQTPPMHVHLKDAEPPHWAQSPGRHAQSAGVVHFTAAAATQYCIAPSFHIDGLDHRHARSLLGQPTESIPPHPDSQPEIMAPDGSRQ